MKKLLRFFSSRRGWSYFLFWSWNIIFLAFMAFGFAPTILPEMQLAVSSGEIPAAFLVYAVILTAIPVVAVILGLTVFRKKPFHLFSFGYVVEGPLMLLLAVRFFVVRQATPAVILLLTVAAVGVLAYLWVLLDRKIEQRSVGLSGVRLFGLTLLLLTGVYVSIWIAFYAVPLGVSAVENIDDFFTEVWWSITNIEWSSIQWRMVPFTILGITLAIYSGTLFVLMPIAVTFLCLRAWGRSIRQMFTRFDGRLAAAIPLITILLVGTGVVLTNRQSQHLAFELLESTPSSAADIETLLRQEERIRGGLLNAYLAPQRYISSMGEVQHVSAMYEDLLDLSPEEAVRVQNAYETVVQPILYQPVEPIPADEITWTNTTFTNEPLRAAELYERYFDEPINKGERETVVQAVRSTWSVDQAVTGWQAVDDREIWLAEQAVTISENGDWAEIELYEVYENQTDQRQEVIYYLSLPESAVVTGVWLGNSAERSERFEHRVAPRGAAQQVYQEQVQRQIDPALVEQIGPSQYRLRVFPIEPRQWDWDDDRGRSTLKDGPPLHLWLTYRVMIDEGGRWPLPYLSEKLNVFWTADSVRTINGQPMLADSETWLPESAAPAQATAPQSHQVTFADGTTVSARPVMPTDTPSPRGDLNLAVVLDRSRSMVDLESDVITALAQIELWGTADVYLTSSEFRGEPPSRTTLDQLIVNEIVYFGGQNPGELLTQFADLYQNERYDAVLVLTDGAGYELGEAQSSIPRLDIPIWMVHLNSEYPIGYTDDHLAAIQASGGGTVGNVQSAMTRLLAGETIDIVDGYVWAVNEPAPAGALVHDATAPFAALAARRVILAEMAANRQTLDQLDTLDALHALAVDQSIVTPYSSMIVLVTRAQEQRLNQLENADDRFEREFEAIGETTAPVTVTGVPEPHEWLLIALAVVMLMWFVRRQQTTDFRQQKVNL